MQLLRDAALIYRRYGAISLRNPVWLLFTLAQPSLYLALFGPLLRNIGGLPGFPSTNSWQMLVPGLLVMLGLYGAIYVGFGIIAEWRQGVTERLHVTPVSRLALLLGRVLRDLTATVVQAVLLVLAGTAFGLRAPLAGVAIALGLTLLVTIGLTSLSYALALALKDEMALAQLLNFLSLPLLLLSGALLPMSLAPPWLDGLSRANPFRYVVTAMREAFLGRYGTGALWAGVIVGVAIAVLGVAASTRAFTKIDV